MIPSSTRTHPILFNRVLNRLLGQRGVSLLESLTVVLVITALISSVGSAVLQTMKTYSGTYASEAMEMELQRAALEMDYLSSTAINAYTWDGDNYFGSVLPPSSQQGAVLVLNQPDGSAYQFAFIPTNVVGNVYTGKLQLQKYAAGSATPSFTYNYSQGITFTAGPGVPRPFWTSYDGGIGYSFAAPTGDGTIHVKGHAASQ